MAPQAGGPAWYAEPCLMGIDEAGRGPVLGPMVYGAAWAPVAARERLARAAYADSKTLTEAQRERLFADIKADAEMGWAVRSLSPVELSAGMLGRERASLNEMSFAAAFELVQRALDAGVNVVELYVDTVGDADRYTERLTKRFPGIKCVAKAKADALFPVVSAASICAKVTRDHELRDWAFVERLPQQPDTDFGCGYPGDELTKAWLERHLDRVFGFPALVRFSWNTTKRALDERGVQVSWEADDEEAAAASWGGGAQAKLSFGGTNAAHLPVALRATSAPDRHAYFRARKIQRVEAF